MYTVGRCLLSDILEEIDMTQSELADRLGVTKQQINTYVTNRRTMDLVTAKNISIIVDRDISDLYEWVHVHYRTKRR